MRMKKYIIYLPLLLTGLLSGCDKDDDKQNQAVDKSALLVGTWLLAETTDPQGPPHELVYTFNEDETVTYRITKRTGREKSIVEGTWRFLDAEQTQLEVVLASSAVHTVDVLDTTTLQLTSGSITMLFSRQ
jgi:hypothetical protein